jgi:hypothetical protein
MDGLDLAAVLLLLFVAGLPILIFLARQRRSKG